MTPSHLSPCLCLWILCHACLGHHDGQSYPEDRDIDLPDNRLSDPIFRHFFDSDSMEETSASDDQLDDSSASDEGRGDGGEEDEFPDASSLPLTRVRASESRDLLSMNQDQAIDQSFNSLRPSRPMIDELLGQSGSEVRQSPAAAPESGEDLFAAAGRHYRQPASEAGQRGFFQYARQPAKGAWEFGYRRGNNEHFTERHEHGESHHVKSKIRWGDKYGGYGEHYFDYNHKGIGEEMPTPRPARHMPRPRGYGNNNQQHRYAASEALPVHQEWPE